jgi:two-component system NtrC family sensor kinase
MLALHAALPDLIIRIDADGTYLDVQAPNESDLAAPLNNIVGQNVVDVLPREIAAKYLYAANRVLLTGEVYEYEYELEVPNGHQVFDARLVKSGPGEVTSIIRNITEKRRMQNEAEQQRVELILERERRTILEHFIQDASHDLRTPITALMTTGILLERYADRVNDQFRALIAAYESGEDAARAKDAFLDTYWRLVERQRIMTISAERLKSLVDAMFDMIRLDTEETVYTRVSQLETIAESVVFMLQPEAEQRGITLKLECEPVPPVRLHAEMMERAVQNLIANALNYTLDAGRVDVRIRRIDDGVALEVADTGIGIAPRHLSRIFQRFYRVDGARTTRTGGSGLGLAITHRIVELHGGKIEVESELGRGSTFRIRLPQA